MAVRAPIGLVGLSIIGIVAGLGYGSLYAWQNYLYLLDVVLTLDW